MKAADRKNCSFYALDINIIMNTLFVSARACALPALSHLIQCVRSIRNIPLPVTFKDRPFMAPRVPHLICQLHDPNHSHSHNTAFHEREMLSSPY